MKIKKGKQKFEFKIIDGVIPESVARGSERNARPTHAAWWKAESNCNTGGGGGGGGGRQTQTAVLRRSCFPQQKRWFCETEKYFGSARALALSQLQCSKGKCWWAKMIMVLLINREWLILSWIRWSTESLLWCYVGGWNGGALVCGLVKRGHQTCILILLAWVVAWLDPWRDIIMSLLYLTVIWFVYVCLVMFYLRFLLILSFICINF